jgi:rSAM/selenodomain-associated transferase 1
MGNRRAAENLLVIMAKEPVPGQVKTRLSPELTPQEAAALYRCFLQDSIAEMGKIDGIDRAIAYTPATARATFAALVDDRFRLFPQQEVELGQRLLTIFKEQAAQGYGAVCIMDSDSPDLPREIVGASFLLLAAGKADVVLGPCTDGGYYLLGMKYPHPELLTDIPWSSGDVLSVTMQKAQRAGLKTALLPPWSDIDTYRGLTAFYRKDITNAGGDSSIANSTRAFLTALNNFPLRHLHQ